MVPGVDLLECIKAKLAVVFDLFHTLTSIETSSARDYPSTSALLGIEGTVWNTLLRERSLENLRGLNRDPFTIIADLARKVRPESSDNDIRRAVESRMIRFEAALRDVPQKNMQVLRTLRERGKLLGLISNVDVMEVHAWSRSPLRGLFDASVFSCHVGYVKPEPEIYRTCTDQLSVEPDQCAFVGDGASDELAGARRLGFATIMTTEFIKNLWPERVPVRRKDADYVIDDLTELL